MKLPLKSQYYVISALTIAIFSALFFVTQAFIANKIALERNKQITEAVNEFTLSTVDKVQEAVERLRAFSSIVVFSQDLSYQTFANYVRDYADNSLNWEIIEWQPLIKSGDKETFKQHVKRTEFPDFVIWEPDKSGNPIPAQQREEHVVVLYMVSESSAANTTGLDLAWSPERLRSKLRSRDAGSAQVSGFFPLVLSPTEIQKPLGFAITLPVYKKGTVPSQVHQRRQQITGFMAAVYSIEKLVESELAALAEAGLHLEIETTDSQQTRAASTIKLNSTLHSAPVFQHSVHLYGRSWVFTMTKVNDDVAGLSQSLLQISPYGFIVFGILVLIFIHLLYTSNNRLVATEQELRTALDTVSRSEQFYLDLSRHDPLTGLLNRRAFLETLILETQRASRYQQPMSFVILDIDNFKHVNDTYGHPSGDAVLIEFAKTITNLSRTTDFSCRFGGEEFALILLNSEADESLVIAKRLCQQIAAHDIQIPSSSDSIRITVSAGLATHDAMESAEELVMRADKALYQAKESGRNCVVVAQERIK